MDKSEIEKLVERDMSSDNHDNSLVFNNSNTFKLYLYLRSSPHQEIGTRETQRQLGFNSPGTVQWHMDKLREAGLVEKLPSNRYQLTEDGREISGVELPLEFPFRFIKNQLIPRSNFQLTFAIVSFGILLYTIYGASPIGVVLVLAQAFMGVHVAIYLWQRLKIMQRLKEFINGSDQ